ncbi:MAG: CheR family methyltransferase [Desulfosalsimonadaceae bacterium]
MINGIPGNILTELSRVVSVHTGLHFPEKKWPALTKGIASVSHMLSLDVYKLLYSLQSASPPKKIIDLITDRLTIGETYFLRDKNFFQILKDRIIRGLIRYPRRKTKKIIFWSAGCATGEEPYSLAILIDHMLPELRDWDVSIIGSDINRAALDKAETGIYSSWSLRETPEPIIKKYFTSSGDNRFELVPHIRRRVSFVQVNLMAEQYGADLNCHDPVDIIVCRNVLMYFNDLNRNRVIQNLARSLIENGWLITGPSESGFVNVPELTSVRFPNALYHRKGAPRQSDIPGIPIRVKRKKNLCASGAPETLKSRLTGKAQTRRSTDVNTASQPEKPNYDVYQDALYDYNTGDYRQSAEKLSRILSGGHNGSQSFLMRAESMILLAKSYANLGDLDHARTWCEKALSFEKLNPELYYLLSTIHQSADDIDAAVKSLKQAIYLDPEFIMAHFTLGMLFQQKNMPFESARSMNSAMSLLRLKDPDDVVSYSESMTASRLIETIKSMTAKG